MPTDPLIGSLILFGFLGICGGVASAIGDPTAPELPLRRACGKSFAGGVGGVFMGFWCFHAYPSDISYQIMAAVGGGFLGPFAIWTLIRLKYGSNSGSGGKPTQPQQPGDKP